MQTSAPGPGSHPVRLLAAWRLRRRELSEQVDALLVHGPAAVDRVAERADQLRAAMAAETQAFQAFVEAAGPHRQVPPLVLDERQHPRDPAPPALRVVR